ncbi:hypothetical protein J3R75_003170 [Oligosphaera ethanolica]|uniref:Uncharacterized protein n=1 Tax=Oligosphaera ethanolica TaxID=760260 RepID=A0AAE3VIJ1_9BACT|nr:hypothetical protein [Oligosphaera ethanolica]
MGEGFARGRKGARPFPPSRALPPIPSPRVLAAGASRQPPERGAPGRGAGVSRHGMPWRYRVARAFPGRGVGVSPTPARRLIDPPQSSTPTVPGRYPGRPASLAPLPAVESGRPAPRHAVALPSRACVSRLWCGRPAPRHAVALPSRARVSRLWCGRPARTVAWVQVLTDIRSALRKRSRDYYPRGKPRGTGQIPAVLVPRASCGCGAGVPPVPASRVRFAVVVRASRPHRRMGPGPHMTPDRPCVSVPGFTTLAASREAPDRYRPSSSRVCLAVVVRASRPSSSRVRLAVVVRASRPHRRMGPGPH